jgi:hypothetical protein
MYGSCGRLVREGTSSGSTYNGMSGKQGRRMEENPAADILSQEAGLKQGRMQNDE